MTKLVKWDDSASAFVDEYDTPRIINNLTGARDIAIFNLSRNITLEQNDYVRIEVANLTSTGNVTAELNGTIVIEER